MRGKPRYARINHDSSYFHALSELMGTYLLKKVNTGSEEMSPTVESKPYHEPEGRSANANETKYESFHDAFRIAEDVILSGYAEHNKILDINGVSRDPSKFAEECQRMKDSFRNEVKVRRLPP